MVRSWVSAAVLGLAALGAAGGAQATQGGQAPPVTPAVLPAFSGLAFCSSGSNPVVTGNPCNTSAGTGSVQAFYVGSPFASAEVSASGAAPPFNVSGLSNGGGADLTYYYTVDGPDNGPIKIDISTNLLTEGTDASSGFAALNTSQGHQVCASFGEGANCAASQFDGTISEFVTPGQVYSIELETSATENGSVGGSAFASADPFIGIDPSDIDPGLYSVRVSDGIVNGLPSGAPEPASWALMLLGFGGLGAAMRSQRRGASAA